MASTRDHDPHCSPPGRPRREHPNPCRPMQIGVIGASFTVQLPITGSAKESAIWSIFEIGGTRGAGVSRCRRGAIRSVQRAPQ